MIKEKIEDDFDGYKFSLNDLVEKFKRIKGFLPFKKFDITYDLNLSAEGCLVNDCFEEEFKQARQSNAGFLVTELKAAPI